MSNTALEIYGALQSAIVALGDLTPEGEQPDPYVADAQSFATQAGVCLEKHLKTQGIEVPKADTSLPVPEMPPPPPPEDFPTPPPRRRANSP